MSTSGDDGSTRFCPGCGRPRSVDDLFCRTCGRSLGADTAPNPVVAPITAPGIPATPPAGAPTGPPPGPAVAPPSGPPPGPYAAPHVAGPPYVGAPPGGTAPAPPHRKGNGALIAVLAAAGAAVLLVAIVTTLALRSRSDGDGSEDVVAEAALVAGAPVTVQLGDDTESVREHHVQVDQGASATVFVTAGRRFVPEVGVVAPNGDAVAVDLVALGNKGAAATFTATQSGQQSIRVGGFGEGQASYEADFRKVRFRTPEQLQVGDCVSRFDDETWARVSGFMLRPCDRPHDGQVFEQQANFGNDEGAAQEQCDAARNERIQIPGLVNWRAYWGPDLTCVVVRGNGSGTLDRSIVSGTN